MAEDWTWNFRLAHYYTYRQ